MTNEERMEFVMAEIKSVQHPNHPASQEARLDMVRRIVDRWEEDIDDIQTEHHFIAH